MSQLVKLRSRAFNRQVALPQPGHGARAKLIALCRAEHGVIAVEKRPGIAFAPVRTTGIFSC